MSILSEIKFNSAGLVPAIAQNESDGQVMMMAWMNAEAVEQTITTGYAHYYSRSRQKQWMKGESSGHVQKVRDMRLDCDGDTILLIIEQTGPACHTMKPNCFFRRYHDGQWQDIEDNDATS